MEQKLKVRTGVREEEGILLNTYKNIPIKEEFIKMYQIMEKAIILIDKVELLLMLFLCRNTDGEGIVYSNKINRDKFIKYIKELSKDKIEYKHQTVTQAFHNLKKLGMLISYEGVTGAYFLNVAFLHIGERADRRQILKNIEEQENGAAEIQSRILQGESL